jgi:hypothetical protein
MPKADQGQLQERKQTLGNGRAKRKRDDTDLDLKAAAADAADGAGDDVQEPPLKRLKPADPAPRVTLDLQISEAQYPLSSKFWRTGRLAFDDLLVVKSEPFFDLARTSAVLSLRQLASAAPDGSAREVLLLHSADNMLQVLCVCVLALR